MKRVLLGVLACALTLGMAASVQAHPPAAHGHRAYYRGCGVRFHGGYYFHRYDHPRWGERRWDAARHCYTYFYPTLNCWYYYNAPRGCYYPVGY
jgi:hypothetical protein